MRDVRKWDALSACGAQWQPFDSPVLCQLRRILTGRQNGTVSTSSEAHSLAFKAGSGTTQIEFSFLYNDPPYDGRYFALLNNVVVSDGPVATPEPASRVLLLFGIGLIGIRAVASTRPATPFSGHALKK